MAPFVLPEKAISDPPTPREIEWGVNHFCRTWGCRPDDPLAWEALAQIAFRHPAISANAVRRLTDIWRQADPEAPLPYLYAMDWANRHGRTGFFRTLVEDARASPAAPSIDREMGLVRGRRRLVAPPGPAPAPQPRFRLDPASRGARSSKPPRRKPQAAERRAKPSNSQASRPADHPPAAAPAVPTLAPLALSASDPTLLAERLTRGALDSLRSLELARRGVEITAADHFDRLLSLDVARGIDQLDHQIETVFRVLKRFRGRVLLADEVGLGKTIEACLVLQEYLLRGLVSRALVLAPPALVDQWRDELTEKFSIECHTTNDPAARTDPAAFWTRGPVIVASLALARRVSHAEFIARQEFDIIIVDEAHHLKNRGTRGYELVQSLRSRFFLLLTATPVETNLSEIYNIVTLLRPGTLGTEREFRQRFVDPSDPSTPRDATGLRGLLRDVMIRNSRARCGLLLPPRTATTIIVEPTPEERGVYAELVDVTRRHGRHHRTQVRSLLEQAGSSPLAVAESIERACARDGAPEFADRLADVARAARALDTTAKLDRLASLLGGDQVLVFCRFRATLTLIARRLQADGHSFVTFQGGMSAAEKEAATAKFRARDAHVMLCSEIGGEGQNLQFCHRLINFDLPWNPMSIEQRIGRIHRIGQTETVEVTNLACGGTAEERILRVLDERVNVFELVVGEMDLVLGEFADERDFGDHVFSIYAESRTDEDLDQGFDGLAESLLAGRQRLEKAKALDEALFSDDYET